MKKRFLFLGIILLILYCMPLIRLKAMLVEPPISTHEGSTVTYIKYDSSMDYGDDISTQFYFFYNITGYIHTSSFDVQFSEGIAKTVPGTFSKLYNCHAFALYFKGIIPNENDAIWISDANIYFTDGSLIEIEISEVENGDIIAYFNGDELKHTGIIKESTDKSLDDLVIRSKDGLGAVLDHTPRVYRDYINDDNIKFYRWNHINNGVYSSYDDSKHYCNCQTCAVRLYDIHNFHYTKLDNAFSHLVSCSICSYSGNQAHSFKQTGSLYMCLVCNFISKFQSITPNSRSNNEILFMCSYDETQRLMTYTEMIYYLIINGYDDLINEFNDFYNNLSK